MGFSGFWPGLFRHSPRSCARRYGIAVLLLLSSIVVFDVAGQGFYQARSSHADSGVLREGDYAIYIGWFPLSYEPGGRSVSYNVYLAWFLGGEPNIGPLLLEWRVVKDYGDYSVVYVHTYFRRVVEAGSPIGLPQPPIPGPGSPGSPSEEAIGGGIDVPFVRLNATDLNEVLAPPNSRVVDVEFEFLVVVDEVGGFIVDSGLRPLAFWPYTMPLEALVRGGEGWRPQYYASGLWNITGASVTSMDNTYIYLPPRGTITGPYSTLRVFWIEASLEDVISGRVGLPQVILELAEDLSKGIMGPANLSKVRFFVSEIYYDLASGVALAYSLIVDPLIYLSEGDLKASLYYSGFIGFPPSDYFLSNRTVAYLVRDLAGRGGFGVQSSLVYLYDASVGGFELAEASRIGLDPVGRALVEMALSKSRLIGGEPVYEGVEFVGGWSWSLVEQALANDTGEAGMGVGTATTTAPASPPAGSPWPVLAAGLGLATTLALLVWVRRR